MKKFLLIPALLLTLALLLSACGGDVTPPATESSTDAATNATTDATTEDEVTEAVTDAATEDEVTEAATEEVTEEVTDAATEEVTEEVTDAATEEVTEEVTDEETEDELADKPVVSEPITAPYLATPADIYNRATFAGANQGIHNQSVSAINNSDYITLQGTSEDCYVALVTSGITTAPSGKYLAIRYRTLDGEGVQGNIFVGTKTDGSLWSGGKDEVYFDYISDGQWHLAIVDLSAVSTYTGTASYLRYDFFTKGLNGSTPRSIDIAYIAAFDSAADAEAYDAYVVSINEVPN